MSFEFELNILQANDGAVGSITGPSHGHARDRRRTTRRRAVEEHGVLNARVRPGLDATLLNVSAGGALIETTHRLLPGSSIELCLDAGDRRTAVRGQVARCAVARLRASRVWYRGAIRFDALLPWFRSDEGNGYAVPIPEM